MKEGICWPTLILLWIFSKLISSRILLSFSFVVPKVGVLSQWRHGPLQLYLEIVTGNKISFCCCFHSFYLCSLIYANCLKLHINYFSKGESTLCTPEGENHRETAFFQAYPPNSAMSSLPGRDFIAGSIQAEFGLPSVRDLGKRILPLKSQVTKKYFYNSSINI